MKIKNAYIKYIFTALIMLFAGVIAVLAVQLSHVGEDVRNSLVSRIADHIRMTLTLYPKPIVENLKTAKELGQSGQLNIKKVSGLNGHFIPVLEQFPHISAVHIADDTGREYLLYEKDNSWVTAEGDVTKHKNRFFFKKWNKELKLIKEWQEEMEYDPRERPWFKGVMVHSGESGEAYWTRPHHFFGTRIPVVSAAVKWKAETGKTVYVAAFDILLKEMLDFKDRLHVTETTKIFLVNTDNSLTDLSLKNFLAEVDEEGKTSSGAPAPRDQQHHRQLLDLAMEKWQSGGKEIEHSFVVRENGTRWWGGFRPLLLSGETIRVGVLVPENELMPDARKRQQMIILIASGVFVIGIILTFLVYRGISGASGDRLFSRRPLYGTEAALFSLIQKGESDELEFKSTLRWNLKTDKSGKEIELAWLKTVAAYMNTQGGILLVGVADDGEILGLDADKFQNDDKCLLHFNNLIKQHIGLEFSRFIRFEIKKAGEQNVFVVECETADTPVFLKTNKGEEFYIRSGPSSIRLTMSEMLNYLNKKGTPS